MRLWRSSHLGWVTAWETIHIEVVDHAQNIVRQVDDAVAVDVEPRVIARFIRLSGVIQLERLDRTNTPNL